MIRVLHSVSNMDRAGIETMLMNYYRHMDRNLIQFDFLCNKKKPGAYDDEILSMGGRIYHTPGLNPLKFLHYQNYMNKFFHEHPEYKIVHVHNGALGVYALIAANRNKIPNRVFHAHGAAITKDIKLPLKLICKSRLHANTNKHWACGKAAAKCYFGERTIKSGNYSIINNAIDLSKFTFNQQVRERMRKIYSLEGKVVIGHVGRFMKQKNHAFLLDIFKQVHKKNPYAVLVLLGDGELQASMIEKSKELNLSEKVFFMGNLDNCNEWYQAFDLFVMPSVWEGLPVVGVEAQAADLPCLFSSKVTREISILPTTQFMDLSETAEVWAEKLLSMIKEKRVDTADIISKAGFQIDLEAQKLQKLYLEMGSI